MSHRLMRAKYAYIVYPRCHDGIGYDKWGRILENCNEQRMVIKKALDRLCKKTMFMEEGWKIIQKYDDSYSFFGQFNLDPEDYVLECEEVLHPNAQSDLSLNQNTSSNNFDDILRTREVLIANCLFNYEKTGNKYSAKNGHSMVLIGLENGEYIFKNTELKNTKIMKIPKNRPTFTQMNDLCQNHFPTKMGFNQNDMFIYDYAYCLRFIKK